MSCVRMRERIHDWFDQRPGGPMPAPVAAHLRECPGCRAFITRWSAVEVRLQTCAADVPPLAQDLTPALRARLADSSLRARRAYGNALRVLAAAALAAAALYLLAGGWLLHLPARAGAYLGTARSLQADPPLARLR